MTARCSVLSCFSASFNSDRRFFGRRRRGLAFSTFLINNQFHLSSVPHVYKYIPLYGSRLIDYADLMLDTANFYFYCA